MSNPFLDQQQQFLNIWADNMAKVPGMEAYANMYRNMIPTAPAPAQPAPAAMPNPVDYWKSFSSAIPGADAWAKAFPNPMEQWTKIFQNPVNPVDFWKNIPGMEAWTQALQTLPNPMEQWTKLAQTAGNPVEYWKTLTEMVPGADTWTKFMPTSIPGMDVYTAMIDLWNGIQNPTEFAKSFQDKYAKLMQTVLASVLPTDIGQFLAQPKELMDSCVALYRYLFGPWMQLDESILQRIASGDNKAYVDFFKAFQARYSETFEKLFNMAGMGLNREANGDYMRCVDAYFQALYATSELMAMINNTWQESAKDLVTSYQKAVAEGKAISTFKDFYDLWFKETEGALETLLNTDEFAETFGRFSDMYCQYTIASNKVMERMLSQLPIPTKTDMDSLYRTVYELRKEARDLRRELDALKAGK